MCRARENLSDIFNQFFKKKCPASRPINFLKQKNYMDDTLSIEKNANKKLWLKMRDDSYKASKAYYTLPKAWRPMFIKRIADQIQVKYNVKSCPFIRIFLKVYWEHVNKKSRIHVIKMICKKAKSKVAARQRGISEIYKLVNHEGSNYEKFNILLYNQFEEVKQLIAFVADRYIVKDWNNPEYKRCMCKWFRKSKQDKEISKKYCKQIYPQCFVVKKKQQPKKVVKAKQKPKKVVEYELKDTVDNFWEDENIDMDKLKRFDEEIIKSGEHQPNDVDNNEEKWKAIDNSIIHEPTL